MRHLVNVSQSSKDHEHKLKVIDSENNERMAPDEQTILKWVLMTYCHCLHKNRNKLQRQNRQRNRQESRLWSQNQKVKKHLKNIDFPRKSIVTTTVGDEVDIFSSENEIESNDYGAEKLLLK